MVFESLPPVFAKCHSHMLGTFVLPSEDLIFKCYSQVLGTSVPYF
jgi:hypothetical protein